MTSTRLVFISGVIVLMSLQYVATGMQRVSHLEIRQEGVVIQSTEYTCGAAAVATLMRFFFALQVSELDVLGLAEESMRSRGVNLEKPHGLTAFDLKQASRAIGLQLAGYLINQSELESYFAQGGLPLIAYLTNPQRHFVVVIGIQDEFVLIADPSWGKKVLGISELDDLREYRGIVLVPMPSQREAGIAKAAQREALLKISDVADHLRALREDMF